MFEPVWWTTTLALLSLATAVVFAVQAARRSGDRAVLGAHAVMGVGMAGMFSPWGDPVPPILGAVVFGLIAAWFVAVRLNRGGHGVDAVTHTAVSAVAMVLMYLWMQPGDPAEAGAAIADGGHHHGAAAGGPAGVLVVVASVLLGAYFIWQAWMCARRMEDDAARPIADPGGDVRVEVRRRIRVVPAAHLVMDALMAVMFLGAL